MWIQGKGTPAPTRARIHTHFQSSKVVPLFFFFLNSDKETDLQTQAPCNLWNRADYKPGRRAEGVRGASEPR